MSNIKSESNYGDDDDSGFIIRLRGLPFTATAKEVLQFLDGVNVVNGEDGVHLTTCARNKSRPSGEAFIELETEEDFNNAFGLDRKKMGTRYIEVFRAKSSDFKYILRKNNVVEKDNTVVKLRGLPWGSTKNDIKKFFDGLELAEENPIHLILDKLGRASGEAFVQFKTPEEYEKALKKHMEKILTRYIEIFSSTKDELQHALCPLESLMNINFSGSNSYGGGSNRPSPYDRNGGGGGGRMGRNNVRGVGGGRNNDPWDDWRPDGSVGGGGNSFGGSFGGGGGGGSGGFGSGMGMNSSNDSFGNRNMGFGGGSIGRSNDGFDNPFGGSNSGFNSGSNMGGTAGGVGGFGSGSGGTVGANGLNTTSSLNFNNYNASTSSFGGSGGSGGGGFDSNISSMGGNFGGGFNNSGGGGINNMNDLFCVNMRGMPYYSDESDITKFFSPLKPVQCKIIYNEKGLHSGLGSAYFSSNEDAKQAMAMDRNKMGSRYIELFYDPPFSNRGGGGGGNRF